MIGSRNRRNSCKVMTHSQHTSQLIERRKTYCKGMPDELSIEKLKGDIAAHCALSVREPHAKSSISERAISAKIAKLSKDVIVSA